MIPTLGVDFFELNGIPANIDLMAASFPFGWYQISNGMSVNVMAFRAWPTYCKYYGGYHFFNPQPDGNWFYQDWDVYAAEAARLFCLVMHNAVSFGGCAPMVDAEVMLSASACAGLYPNETPANQRVLGNLLYFHLLKVWCDAVQSLTGMISIIYTGFNFWISLGGAAQSWAANHPLTLAVYPYDNYTNQAEYLAAIQGVMNGTKPLPAASVPKPWVKADYIQFTGRAPASLIPGYATGGNWAKTVDMSIKVVSAPAPVPVPGSVGTAYKVLAGYNPNVHTSPGQSTPVIGYIMSGSTVYVDSTSGGYSHVLPCDGFSPAGQAVHFSSGGWIISIYLVLAA